MKRRFLAALLVVTLLVPVITACHDSSTQTATKDVKATGYDPKEAVKDFDFGDLPTANHPATISDRPRAR